MLKYLLGLALTFFPSTGWTAPSECNHFLGAKLFSSDGDYLGSLSDKYGEAESRSKT